jgi:membrane protein CcdC involved in cytochrome C biogenesis
MHASALPANPLQVIATISIVLVAMALRMRRMRRARPLRIEHLWIVPAIFLAIAGLVLWQMPPTLNDTPWLIGALVMGGVIGWYRGKTMRISVDPATHAVSQSASPWAMIFLVALLGVRYAARYFLAEEAESWHISLNVLTDAPLVLLVGMLTLTRIEMYLRAQKLLKAARAAKTEAQP